MFFSVHPADWVFIHPLIGQVEENHAVLRGTRAVVSREYNLPCSHSEKMIYLGLPNILDQKYLQKNPQKNQPGIIWHCNIANSTVYTAGKWQPRSKLYYSQSLFNACQTTWSSRVYTSAKNRFLFIFGQLQFSFTFNFRTRMFFSFNCLNGTVHESYDVPWCTGQFMLIAML